VRSLVTTDSQGGRRVGNQNLLSEDTCFKEEGISKETVSILVVDCDGGEGRLFFSDEVGMGGYDKKKT